MLPKPILVVLLIFFLCSHLRLFTFPIMQFCCNAPPTDVLQGGLSIMKLANDFQQVPPLYSCSWPYWSYILSWQYIRCFFYASIIWVCPKHVNQFWPYLLLGLETNLLVINMNPSCLQMKCVTLHHLVHLSLCWLMKGECIWLPALTENIVWNVFCHTSILSTYPCQWTFHHLEDGQNSICECGK